MSNPFLVETVQPLVAVCGPRNGYLQIASSRLTADYKALPDTLFSAARAWAETLESLGAKRVYWITLSEMITHLHIHLYPRWNDEEARGIALFEARDSAGQPEWSDALRQALQGWAATHHVHLISC